MPRSQSIRSVSPAFSLLFGPIVWATMGGASLAQTVPGAVAHWPFDDGQSLTTDIVGGQDGVVEGATFNLADIAPLSGNFSSLEFNGAGARVGVASTSALSFGAGDPMTIALWIKKTSDPGVVHILGKRSGCQMGTSGINYQLASTPTGGFEFASESSGVFASQASIPVGSWTHLAVTYDGVGTLRLYIGAVQVALSTSYLLSGVSTAPLEIGASGDCGQSFPGLIDDVWIFDRRLSPAEIALVAGISPAGYCTPKVNSLGCTPTIGFLGLPTISGPDNFSVTASSVVNNKSGLMLWGGVEASAPFFGGTLCIAPPVIRTPMQNSGGTPPPPSDCTGSYSYHFTQAYMASHLLGPGSTVYAQYWSRDPGFAFPNNVGLTNGLRFTIYP